MTTTKKTYIVPATGIAHLTGATYQHRAILRANGWTWNKWTEAWSKSVEAGKKLAERAGCCCYVMPAGSTFQAPVYDLQARVHDTTHDKAIERMAHRDGMSSRDARAQYESGER